MKQIFFNWFIVLLFMSIGTVHAEQSPKTLSQFIKEHAAEFQALNKNRRAKELESTAPPLEPLLEKAKSDSDPEVVLDLLYRMVELDRAIRLNERNELDLRNPLVIQALLISINHSDASIRQKARSYLTELTNPIYLRSEVDYLLATPSNLSDPRFLHLVGLLNDTIEVRQILLPMSAKQKDFPIEIKGRLGDQVAERQLIDSFTNSTNAATKADLALKVGYVGTPGCVYALAKEMRDPRVEREGYNSYSVRYRILQGLGQALPQEKLFNEDLVAIDQATLYDDPKTGEPYMDRVEKWCETNFDIKWKTPRPPFFLRYNNPQP